MSVWIFCVQILCLVLGRVHSNGNSNANFNASLRDYSVIEDSNNTIVKTLQAGGQMYPMFSLPRGPTRYKEVPDNIISSSSHSRGLLHHERHEPGYEVQDYDEALHGYYGPYSPHHEHHPIHYGHDHDHHLDYHHHKHYDPGLKAILLPVAGLAILGAAAALVTNPVLLQLGVVSGRRRRDTTPHDNELIEKLVSPVYEPHKASNRKAETPMKSRPKIWRHPAQAFRVRVSDSDNNEDDDYKFIPIPLKMRERRGTI